MTASGGRATGGGRSARPVATACAAAVLAAATAAACGGEARESAASPRLELAFRVEGLSDPESVAWDSLRRRWLVTNARGGEEGGGRGFVTAVAPGGDSVIRRAYASDTPGLRLDAPRGIAVRGDRAYLADLHRLVAIDLARGEAAFELRIPEAERLEDVAVDRRGVIYLSDARGDALFRAAPDGSGWTQLGAAGSLRGPSGLLVEPAAQHGGERLLVAGREGAVVALNPDSSVTLVAGSTVFRRLHGIQRGPGGSLVVSDHGAGRLHLLRPAPGRVRVRTHGTSWLSGLEQPADFSIHGDMLALPETAADRVSFYRLVE